MIYYRSRKNDYIIFHSSSVVEQSAVNRSVVGSSPTCGAIASIAQQVEHHHGKVGVSGSNPLGSFYRSIDVEGFLR